MQESEQRHHKDTIHVLSVTNGPGNRKFAEINTKPAVEEQPAPAGAAGGAGAFFPNRGGAAGQGLSPVPFLPFVPGRHPGWLGGRWRVCLFAEQ